MSPSLPWRQALLGLLGVGMTASILSSVLAPSPTTPRDTDVQQAGEPVGDGPDERLAAPSGDRVAGNGVVEPRDREVRVAASVPGRIAEVRVVEGQRVVAGDPLLLLDHELEEAAVASAQADVQAARAELARLRAGARPQELDGARHEARGAEARAASSADAAARQERLAAGGHVAPDELERARRSAEVDAEAAGQARARLALLEAGTRREEIDAAAARLSAAEARLSESEARLAQRTVRAPVDGEVLQVLVRPGEYQQPGGAEPLLLLGDTRGLRVRMDVDERDVQRVRVGASAVLRATALDATEVRATVAEIGRRMGRKNIRTDDPIERNDTKVLEVVLDVSGDAPLIVGQRVLVFVDAPAGG
jgi:HlyD family secretion protein